MKNNKYIKQSYVIDYNYAAKNWGKWAVVEIIKDNLRVIRWAKSLKKALILGKKVKDPIYFLSVPSACGIFVPVLVCYKNRGIKILCTVDTGAYFCGFSTEVAQVLGIDLKKHKKKRLYGINGFSDHIEVKDIKIQLPEEKRAVKLTVMFGGRKDTPSLLGCYGFLNFYEVCFNPSYGMKFRYLGKK